jgi:hypothetical protein
VPEPSVTAVGMVAGLVVVSIESTEFQVINWGATITD